MFFSYLSSVQEVGVRNNLTSMMVTMYINCEPSNIKIPDVFDLTRVKYDYDNSSALTNIKVDLVNDVNGNDYIYGKHD